MTSFLSLAKDRYSVRNFEKRAIAPDVMAQVLEAARVSPTACNNQPQRIKVITDIEALKLVDECTPCRFDAPAVLLVCYDKNVCWTRRFDGAKSGEVDASIAATHLMLAAHDLGLVTCWVMYFDPAKTSALFELPDHIVPVAMLPIGYPAKEATPAKGHADKQPIEDFLL